MDSIFLIAFIFSFGIGYAGFVDEIEGWLKRKWNRFAHIPKPFSCELCMTFWTAMIYGLCTSQFSWAWIAMSCVGAASTAVMVPLIHLIVDFLKGMINSIYDIFNL